MTKDTGVLALMREDAAKPPPKDRLEALRLKIAELRALELERETISERLAENGKKLFEMKTKTIVELFDRAKVDNVGIPEDGNLPAYNVEVGWVYSAKLSTLTPEEFAKAVAYIKKHEPDMLKTTYTINFGMGEDKRRKAFEALLKKNKFDYSSSFGVPPNTLTAWVKEQIEVHKKSPPLKLLGATAERIVKLIKPKATRAKKAASDAKSNPRKGK
jgi:hypothetical protein